MMADPAHFKQLLTTRARKSPIQTTASTHHFSALETTP
jgi:hypothetical protein